MNSLPRVTARAREQLSKDLDNRGPDACMAAVLSILEKDNPELLDMARKCAADVGDEEKVMLGFAMFYQLLLSSAGFGLDGFGQLPRVTAQTRNALVDEIDIEGVEAFTLRAIEDLDVSNPELLQMAHNFAARHKHYLGVMQGFALFHRSLSFQARLDRRSLH